LAREVVRAVQEARRAAGLEVSDRIVLGLQASGALGEAIAEHLDRIAGETLGVEVTDGSIEPVTGSVEIDGNHLTIGLRKV
jgi:isoleucyl-tRNA synthetase